jgi:hypothetical protein
MAVVLPPNATVGSLVGVGANARLFVTVETVVIAGPDAGTIAVLAWSAGVTIAVPMPERVAKLAV